tara:strand:- start:604 stop:1209 length:606 start_codon:yes stop_codon:yes gene_type:complete
MPKKIPTDHPSLNLEESLEYVFLNLEKGVIEGKHDFHLLVLATIDENNKPQNRNVVLRKVDISNSLVKFHTDKRSNKIKDLNHNHSISLLGYDKSAKLQIRLGAKAVIEKSNEVLIDVWSKMRPMSRACYRVKDTPGKIISSRNDVIFENEDEKKLNGFENFVIVNCHIQSIETLFLHSAGHIRAKYLYKDNAFHGSWLVP